MKKLMFIAAAMACIGLNAEITSANVVGYDSVGLLSGGGAKGVGASFINVDKTDLTLKDLKVIGYEGEYGEFQVYAQKLDRAGRTIDNLSYFWCDYTEEGTTYYGWYDGDMNPYNDEPLVPGEGLWIYSPDTKFQIQSSGQVPDSPIAVTLLSGGGAKMVVNPMPATLKFGQIVVKGYTGEYGEFQVYAQRLDRAGRTIDNLSYFWCDYTEEGTTYYGWYDGDMNPYNDEELKPGEGLWTYSPSTNFQVEFPSVL